MQYENGNRLIQYGVPIGLLTIVGFLGWSIYLASHRDNTKEEGTVIVSDPGLTDSNIEGVIAELSLAANLAFFDYPRLTEVQAANRLFAVLAVEKTISSEFHKGMWILAANLSKDGYFVGREEFQLNMRDMTRALTGALVHKKELGIDRRWEILRSDAKQNWVSCRVVGDVGIDRLTLFNALREEWRRLLHPLGKEDFLIGVALIDSIEKEDVEDAEESSLRFTFFATVEVLVDGRSLLTVEFVPPSR